MKVWQAWVLLPAGALLIGLSGCEGHIAVRGPRVYVAADEPAYVAVETAPPEPIVEAPPPAPAYGYVWIGGYWYWGGHRYLWARGRWERPPHERAYWVAPRYERGERGYHYVPGHWRDRGEQRR